MERNRLGRDISALVATSLGSRGVLAAFTERTGGVSDAPHDTLNLGFHAGDRADRVVENRRRVIAGLDVPPFAVARQLHGCGVARVGTMRAGAGFADPDGVAGADILVATRPGIPVAVLVADCLPIVLSDRRGTVIAVHAGWRGLAAGILDRALALTAGHEVAAAIGPAIGPCHYEVGREVVEAVDRGTGGMARTSGSRFLDLAATAAASLRRGGVRDLEVAGKCTACLETRFFSHRRDGVTGRQALVAMRL
jgi:polyphenol oxidase